MSEYVPLVEELDPSASPASEWAQVDSDENARKRLAEFVDGAFSSAHDFYRFSGVPRSTLAEWRRGHGSLPGFQKLRALADKGLSLDWLMTGDGPMKRSRARKDASILIYHLRPYLQRAARIDDEAERRAFNHLVATLGVDGMLEKAAAGLMPLYASALSAITRVATVSQFTKYLNERLERIEASALTGDASAIRQMLTDVREYIAALLPQEFRDNQEAADALRMELKTVFAQRAAARKTGAHGAFFPTARIVLDAVAGTTRKLSELDERASDAQKAYAAELNSIARVLASLAVQVCALAPSRPIRKTKGTAKRTRMTPRSGK